MKEKQTVPVLYKEKADCCGCGACFNVCPRQAIAMKEDQCGFLYPEIDASVCVGCGRCRSVCSYQNEKVSHSPVKTFAAVARDRNIVKKSASGGIFAALAGKMIMEGGVVYGAAFWRDWSVQHTGIESISQLHRLQGSKYTQSSTGTSFRQVKHYLEQGRKVLYSGTPCQIAGLYGYLGKDDENLITVDIICHGVPSGRMFQDYIRQLETDNGGKVTAFSFRDKSAGWGINGCALIEKKGISVRKRIWQSASSYLFYFTRGWIYRENCYQCKYACSHRPADLTLGDYWGIEKVHPEYLGKGEWDESEGISVVIANSQKGLETLEQLGELIELKPSSFEKAAWKNGQLNHPSKPGSRDELLKQYASGGWSALENRFHKNIGWRKYSSQVKSVIPAGIKRRLKGL